MPEKPPDIDNHSDRRTFIKQGLLGAGALLLGGGAGAADAEAARNRGRHARAIRHRDAGERHRPPNILVIVVDQLRTPVWMPAGVTPATVMPNLASLRQGAVNFESHYTASNDCSPARGALVTGLYSHQSGCMVTGASRLDPGFPTWGTLLRERGYHTNWWGKWHLNPNRNASLEPYGFAGGTYPSPNGAPGQGTAVDPEIATQFAQWFAQAGGDEPWCSTVSFVNPHDVAWWYRFTSKNPAESSPPFLADELPANFETPEMLEAQRKPRLQRSLQDTAARSFGEVPFSGPEALPMWSGLMDTYLMLQGYVDQQIRAVLRTLLTQPEGRANTVVVFTSDHGEYGGSHGMRGKGASAYEEAIRVPLSVRDLRPAGRAITAATGVPRTQLTSSVDVVGLLLTLGTGSNAWRSEKRYEHLASRHDLAAICRHPGAPGRDWILHATDEDITEFATEPYASEAPRHVVAVRSRAGKLVVYSNWRAETTEQETAGQEYELYDYSEPGGRVETVNSAGAQSPLEEELWNILERDAVPRELQEPLPFALREAQQSGVSDYANVEQRMDIELYVKHQEENPGTIEETQVG
ncbi:MAG TPA: sulfatase-like hydrolase/transferase [Solirubrobacteraceae bacterium]|nr:sulfatase-like hydrolase/transferase [Solirubrobacteraceae bacterium]